MMKKQIIGGILLCLALFTMIGLGTFAEEEPPSLEIAAKALELEATVGISFAVPKEPTNGAQVGLLVWTEARSDAYTFGTQDAFLSSDEEDTVDGTLCLIFTYDALAAKQLTDDIYVRAFAEVDGTAYYSEVEKYSVLQYAYNKLGKTGVATTDTNLYATLSALLEYGAEAQRLFEYRLDRLANEAYYQISAVNGWIASDLSSCGLYKTDAIVLLSAAESLQSMVFSHWENALGEVVGTDLTLSVTVTDKNDVFTAVYQEAPASDRAAVSVVNGTIQSPSDDGLYEIGSELVLVANENENACFSHWENAAGVLLGTDSSLTTTVSATAEVYTAVYATDYKYFNFERYTEASQMVSWNTNYTDYPEDIIIPRSYNREPVESISNSGFKNNKSIKTVVLPESIQVIQDQAFLGCTSLKTISMERCTTLTTIPSQCFESCTALTTVTLPSSITTIDTRAFYKCSKLESISLPSNLSYIGSYAFHACSKLTSVIFEAPSGWSCGNTALAESTLSDSTSAASKLKTHYEDVWQKN